MFDQLSEKLDLIFRKLRGTGKLTESNISESLREVRRILLQSDVNFTVVKDFIAQVQQRAVGEEVLRSITPGQQVIKIIHQHLIEILGGNNVPFDVSGEPPVPVMVVGLQGSGKTTFCAKLALRLKNKGKNPLLVAIDVYRPAAIKQLQILGDSIKVPVFSSEGEVSTIAAQALNRARQSGADTVIFDTAGRLHIDESMMQELVTLKALLKPKEILFVADGMTGQDAVKSAQTFNQALNLTGMVLTKMDGDARGGAALSIRMVTGKPIKFLGTGEKTDALEPFYPDRIASRILGMGDVVTLVEKAREKLDLEKAEKLAAKIQSAQFNLDDFLLQLRQIKAMGSISEILKMVPGMGIKLKNTQFDENALKQTEAIICSMTTEERIRPHIINGSRRLRIARGSGTTVQDVNRLLNQFQQMQKLIKQFGSAKGKFRSPFFRERRTEN
jgi:signal recognition particle subunit SRP54